MDKFGFFEVCCREKALKGVGASFTERSEPFSDRLTHLQNLAQKGGCPFVFTICCAERFVTKDNPDNVLVVPRDPSDRDWMTKTASHCVFNIEKKPDDGDIEKGDAERIWDMFLHNANAARLIEKLNVDRWVVYGVGIDLCVSSAVKGLLKAGVNVTILIDVLTSNEGGDEESMKRMLDQLSEMGAAAMTYAEFVRNFRSDAE